LPWNCRAKTADFESSRIGGCETVPDWFFKEHFALQLQRFERCPGGWREPERSNEDLIPKNSPSVSENYTILAPLDGKSLN
jgi:hypothetical protein